MIDKNDIQGFTLFELLYVVGIIGILASIALPSFSQQLKQDRLVSNANQLQSVFKYARSEAAKRESSISLAVDNGSWQVKLGNVELQRFSPTHDSITVLGLADLDISATGETNNATFSITDSDSTTTDYCMTILVSGQSLLTKSNNC